MKIECHRFNQGSLNCAVSIAKKNRRKFSKRDSKKIFVLLFMFENWTS